MPSSNTFLLKVLDVCCKITLPKKFGLHYGHVFDGKFCLKMQYLFSN